MTPQATPQDNNANPSLRRAFKRFWEQGAALRSRRVGVKVFEALENDDTAAAIKLLTSCPAALKERNAQQLTPFEAAVFNSRKTAAAKAIAAAFPDVLEERGFHGETIALQAARHGTWMALDLLITLGAKLDAVDDKGNTALHYATDGLPMPVLEQLLKAGLDPNARNNDGETPLMTGVRRQTDPDFIAVLAFYKADIHAVNNKGENATMQAMHYSMLDNAAALMKLEGVIDPDSSAVQLAKVVANMEVNTVFLIQLEATLRDQPARLARAEAEAAAKATADAQRKKHAERHEITTTIMTGNTPVRGMKTVRFAKKGAQKP